MEGLWENIKKHPYLAVGGLIIGFILLYYLLGSSSATPANNQAAIDAANFATQTQGATQLAVAQAAQQASQYHDQTLAQENSDLINGQISLGTLAAQTQQNAQQLQAGVQESAIAGAVTINQQNNFTAQTQSSLAAQVAENQVNQAANVALSGQNYAYMTSHDANTTALGIAQLQETASEAALAGSLGRTSSSSFTSPFISGNYGATVLPVNPNPPPPPPPPVAAASPSYFLVNSAPDAGAGISINPSSNLSAYAANGMQNLPIAQPAAASNPYAPPTQPLGSGTPLLDFAYQYSPFGQATTPAELSSLYNSFFTPPASAGGNS